MHKDTQIIPKTPGKFFFFALKPVKKYALLAFVFVAIGEALGSSLSFFIKWIVDAAAAGDLNRVFWISLALPVTMFVVQILYRVSGFLGMNAVIRLKRSITTRLADYVLDHETSYFADRFSGATSNKILSVSRSIETLFENILWWYFSLLISFSTSIVFILWIDLYVGLIFASLIFVLFFFNKIISPTRQRYAKEESEEGSRLTGFVVDMFSNILSIKQYVQKNKEMRGLRARLDSEYKKRRRAWIHTETVLIYNSVILLVFLLGLFFMLYYQLSVGIVSYGDFAFVISRVLSLAGSLLFIANVFGSSARAMGELEESISDLLIDHGINDAQKAKKLSVSSGEIIFDNVVFSYEKNQKSLFNNFNLAINSNQKIGLVGSSGAGKTSFVSLLLRQHELNSGSITIDGQNIAEITQESLRKNISIVPQEPTLFHRTIKENILYGNPTASEKEMISAAKSAEAHAFIKSLPKGYKTLVGERGVKLSGGQRQRIVIARAMLKNAPILVLDEATSALDSESEVLIQKALKKLMKGKTVIAIAHRLSTLREMDRIVVMKKGKIVEDGSHDTLATSGGQYQKLWEHQAGGFLQED